MKSSGFISRTGGWKAAGKALRPFFCLPALRLPASQKESTVQGKLRSASPLRGPGLRSLFFALRPRKFRPEGGQYGS